MIAAALLTVLLGTEPSSAPLEPSIEAASTPTPAASVEENEDAEEGEGEEEAGEDAEPSASPEVGAAVVPADQRWTEGELMREAVEHHAQAAMRRRRWRSGLGVSLGSLQVGVGVYGLASSRFDSVMKRSAFAQTLLGTAGVGLGIYGLVRPSAIERLRKSPEYAMLLDDPNDVDARRRLRQKWANEARRAQIWRYVMGGGYIAGGLGLTAVGAIFQFYDGRNRSGTETLWSFSTLGTGVGLVLVGSLGITIHSHVEQTYETFVSLFGWPPHHPPGRPLRGAHIRVGPMLGGVQVSGQF